LAPLLEAHCRALASARTAQQSSDNSFVPRTPRGSYPAVGGICYRPGGTGTVNGQPTVSQPDASGNTYVTDYFNGTITLGSTTLTATGSSFSSFVAKVDPNGTVLWAKQFGGGSGNNGWTGIATDTNGDVYLSGNFENTQNFGPNISLTTTNPAAGYIAKVDPNGNFLWAKGYAYQTDASDGNRLAVDGSGNAYLTWYAAVTGVPNVPTEGFLSKYDTNGNLQWTQPNNPIAATPDCVAVDSSGNAYAAGGTPQGGFITKYDPNGNVIWSQATPRQILADAIYQDPTTGNTYLYTTAWPTTALPTNVQKWDATTGTLLASQQIGLPSVRPWGLAVDSNGDVYLTGGQVSGTTDLDPGPGNATITAQGGDVVVVKLDPSLNFLSAYDFGGNSNSLAWSVAVGPDGSIYTAGSISGPVNFDTGNQIVQLPGSGNGTLFFVKTTQDTGMIFGRVFNDLNNNGVLDTGEAGISGVQVYLDLNNSGVYVTGDPTTTTDAQGYYHFTDVTPGTYTVRQTVPTGYTANPTSFSISVSAGLASELGNFADHTPNTTRNYSNSTSISTSKGKPNAVSSLSVSANPDYTVLGITLSLTVNDPSNNTLTIFLTGPNGTKIDVGSTNKSGTLTFLVTGLDYTAVNGKWTLEVDGLGQGGVLKSWSLGIDGTLS
jgi:hypothetical protein